MPGKLTMKQVAWRVAQDLRDGDYVNLGIGVPELVARYTPDDRDVIYHTENGVLGFGPPPPPGEEDWDLINAGKKPISLAPGACLFHHADSFAMVRGGHLSVAVLGAYQVAQNGDLANWRLGSAGIPAVGGAMDLAYGAERVVVIMDHVTKQNEPKLVETCTHPLTGKGCVTQVYTNLATIGIDDGRFVLHEKIPDMDLETLQALTGAVLHVTGKVAELDAPEISDE